MNNLGLAGNLWFNRAEHKFLGGDRINNLGLKTGSEAYGIIKASSVIIGTDLHNAKVSAVITHGRSKQLELKVGGHACTLFKASSVIIGIN